jgi:hypothetical protein
MLYSMPYQINQISPRKFEVVNTETGTIHSKGTTKKKAEAQLRLLDNLEKKIMKPTKGKGVSFSRQRRVAPAPIATPVPENAVPTPRARRTVAQVVPEPTELTAVIPVVADEYSRFSLEQLLDRRIQLETEQSRLVGQNLASFNMPSSQSRMRSRAKRALRINHINSQLRELDARIAERDQELDADIPVATPIGRGLKDTAVALFQGRSKFSPAIQSILNKHGDTKIRGATIKRSPVPSLITKALGTISPEFGKRLKESPYDKLFHLFLVLQLENGKVVVVEKNETLSVTDRYKKRSKEEEEMPVSVPEGLTLNTALEKTQQSMGTQKFFGYSAKDNNCQDFMIAFLKANNMGNEEVFKFVKQDTAYLFKNLPILRKISNTLTDIAGRANVAMEGSGMKEKIQLFKERIKGLEGQRQKYWNENKQDILEILNRDIEKLQKELDAMQNERYYEACDKVRDELEMSSSDKRPEGVKPIPDARGLGGAGVKPKIQKGSQEALEWCKRMREAKMAKNKK